MKVLLLAVPAPFELVARHRRENLLRDRATARPSSAITSLQWSKNISEHFFFPHIGSDVDVMEEDRKSPSVSPLCGSQLSQRYARFGISADLTADFQASATYFLPGIVELLSVHEVFRPSLI